MPGNQTAQAAVLPNMVGKMPLDLRLDSKERPKDSVVIIRDTVTVTNTVYKRVPKLKCTTDTLIAPMLMPGPMSPMPVKETISGDREEYTPVTMPSSKQSYVRLIVDGKVVYETENDIHSAEEGQ